MTTVAEALGSPRTLPRPSRQRGVRSDEELRLLNDKLVEKVGELESANGERRKLLGQLLTAHEEERERIAEDLHDDSIQAMVALRMRLETLAARTDSTRAGRRAGRVEGGRRGSGRAPAAPPVRATARGAGQERGGGGAQGLPRAGERRGRAGTTSSTDRTTRRPTEAVRTLLYRVGREALANVRKHAQASHVEVHIDDDTNGFSLKVRDDGKGFDPEQGLRVRRRAPRPPGDARAGRDRRRAPEGGEPAGHGHRARGLVAGLRVTDGIGRSTP